MALSALLAWCLGAAGGAAALLLWQHLQQRSRTRQQRRQPGGGTPAVSLRQLQEWIDAVPQGWLVLTPSNRIHQLNSRAALLLEVESQRSQLQGEPVERLEPSDELLHLVELARETRLPQRGHWLLRQMQLELRLLPGRQGWVAVVLQGPNPLEAQLEQQDQWVSDVAHELKTPLTALALVGESLTLHAEGRQAVLVERLQRELQRLQRLVSDLLDLSRLDNTVMGDETGRGAIDPRDVLGSVWSSLELLAEQQQVQLSVQPGREEARLAAVDPARLHQALFNLLDNALRYSPPGSRIEVDLRQRNRWCLIRVRDHGPGLSEQDRQRLFERFYRGDASRSRSPRQGSGLGLAIVQQIARSQGGMVRAFNHPQGGAVLELVLRRA